MARFARDACLDGRSRSCIYFLIQACDQLDSTTTVDDSVDDNEQAEKYFFEYLVTAYSAYMAGSDNFDSMELVLFENFERKNNSVIKQVERLSKELAVLEKEWSSLQDNDSPLVVAERERTTLQADKEKFQVYLTHQESKCAKLSSAVETLKQDIIAIESNTEELYREKQALQETIDQQELSPADVDRMNAERDQLSSSLNLTRDNLDSATKRVWQGEITLQKTMDRLETGVHEFNNLLHKLDTLNSEYSGLNRELELNISAKRQSEMVSIDLCGSSKPSCNEYISNQKKQAHNTQDDIFQLQEKMDAVSWSHIQKQEQVNALKATLETLNERYQDQKKFISQQLTQANQEFTNWNRSIERMKLESNQMQINSAHKLQKLQSEYH